MTFEEFIAVSLRFVAAVGVIQLLLHIVGANLYDVKAVKRQRQFREHPHARRFRGRPLVSVVIVTRNDEMVIENCLKSVFASTYRKLEVIVVDNVSTDDTKRKIAAFNAENPERAVKLFAKRVPATRAVAARDGYKRYGHGDLVMVLEAGQMPDRAALTRAVRYFNGDEKLTTLTPKVNIHAAYSALGVLQRYQSALAGKSAKARSALNFDNGVSYPLIYRRSAVDNYKVSRWRYADDVMIYESPPESFFQLAARCFRAVAGQSPMPGDRNNIPSWLRYLLVVCTGLSAILVPLLSGYFIYLAAVLQEPTYLLAVIGLLSLLLTFAIWEDAQLKSYQKLNYTLGIPLAYGFYLAVTIIQAGAVIAAAFSPRKLSRHA